MENTDYLVSRYDSAVLCLPEHLRARLRAVDKPLRAQAEEIRLRVCQPVSLVLPESELRLPGPPITQEDLERCLSVMTRASAYAVKDHLKSGFVTARGGHRIGLCGQAVTERGHVMGFRTVSSMSVRIAKEVRGAAKQVMGEIAPGGRPVSTLIISPPGCGKTTLLRDIIRHLSNGDPAGKRKSVRVALADERNEVASVWHGAPQMDVGMCTDVLDSCAKSEAVMMLLRGMNPQVIALDEITAPEDVSAVIQAANCGVKLIATAHGEDAGDLNRRPVYRALFQARVFERAIVIWKDAGGRHYRTESLEGMHCD